MADKKLSLGRKFVLTCLIVLLVPMFVLGWQFDWYKKCTWTGCIDEPSMANAIFGDNPEYQYVFRLPSLGEPNRAYFDGLITRGAGRKAFGAVMFHREILASDYLLVNSDQVNLLMHIGNNLPYIPVLSRRFSDLKEKELSDFIDKLKPLSKPDDEGHIEEDEDFGTTRFFYNVLLEEGSKKITRNRLGDYFLKSGATATDEFLISDRCHILRYRMKNTIIGGVSFIDHQEYSSDFANCVGAATLVFYGVSNPEQYLKTAEAQLSRNDATLHGQTTYLPDGRWYWNVLPQIYNNKWSNRPLPLGARREEVVSFH